VSVEIRHLSAPEDALLAVDLQRAVWGGDETPAHVMLTAAHNGGLLAGAFVDDTLAGFVWGFLGLDERADPPRLKHCSHQLGVHPRYRSLGLGFQLKRFQREFVCMQGIELITWTYDPLLAANAYLNIARLGAVCSTYHRDEYGDLNDDLNAGLPTDRFQVDLWVNSARVREAMCGTARQVGSVETPWCPNSPAAGGEVRPPDARSLDRLRDFRPATVALAIPTDFQALRAADPALASAWRYATRDAFECLFASGYTVVNFARQVGYGRYLLEQGHGLPA
jgi:predicted GNAT superfamily acetyltransferase